MKNRACVACATALAFASLANVRAARADEPVASPAVTPSPAAAAPVTPTPVASPPVVTAPPVTPPPVAAPPPPPETPHEPFGDARVLVISAGTTASFSYESGGGVKYTDVELEPSVDYFVVRHLSLGGYFLLSNDHASGTGVILDQTFTYGVAPRIGCDLPVSEHFSIWPKASVVFEHTHITGVYVAPTTDITLDLYVPFLFHPVPHFFVGAGPYLDTLLKSDTNGETTVGVKLSIGGWVGL